MGKKTHLQRDQKQIALGQFSPNILGLVRRFWYFFCCNEGLSQKKKLLKDQLDLGGKFSN
jgi:hypothetical protein